MASPGMVQAAVLVVTATSGYVGYVARRVSGWVDEQERRTDANEVRSHANRQAVADVVKDDNVDVDHLPPADDPAQDRLGRVRTDGGGFDGSR